MLWVANGSMQLNQQRKPDTKHYQGNEEVAIGNNGSGLSGEFHPHRRFSHAKWEFG
jgi:hypothetical protein